MSRLRTCALLSSLCLSSALLSNFVASQGYSSSQSEATFKEVCCERTPHPQRTEFKHIESKGIGYNQGYSSFEGFFTVPSTLQKTWAPFLDVRAHVFNNGLPAVNAGFGLRYLNTRVWGANLYYDYRKTHRFHYNQVGAGLETLGKVWDFRINGYFPVGETKSSRYRFRFDKFTGNRMILSNKREFAMTGGNAEIGAHAYHRRKVDLYAALGPYYFTGQGHSAWGGEGRLALTALKFLRLQLSGSYDKIFKGIVQGEASLIYTWGGKKTIKKRPCLDCTESARIVDRALQRVDRQEMIVVDHKHEKSTAIDPATGQPFTFLFVNNTSHSLGTFESPFNTLLTAESASGPNDLIYVFVGDGTDTGMDSGITLQNGQQLLGAGIGQQVKTTHGTITIPAHDVGLPIISNTNDPTGLGVQLVAGNNVVSGFNLQDKIGGFVSPFYTGALTIRDGSNYLIQNNKFSTFNNGNCLNIYGPGDNTAIINNMLIGNDAQDTDGIYFSDVQTAITGSFYIANNIFTGANDTAGLASVIDLSVQQFSNISVNIDSNTITSHNNNGFAGIDCFSDIGSLSNISLFIVGNYIDISPFNGMAGGVVLEQKDPASLLTASLANNVSITTPPVPGYKFVNTSGNPAAMQIDFSSSNVGTREGPP